MSRQQMRHRSGGVRVETLESRQFLSATIHVPATSDLWKLASKSPAQNGTFPPGINLPAGIGRVLSFSSVTGTVSLGPGFSADPDGQGTPTRSMDVSAVGGISGIIDNGSNGFALIGVFTANNIPTSQPPPTQDNTNIRGNTNFSPLLDQTFFVGDGKTGTGTGATQQFHIPNGATRLYLGFPDAGNFRGPPGAYSDNTGSLTAILNITVPPQPQFVTGNVFKDLNGDGKQESNEAGLANWRVYIDKYADGRFDPGDINVLTNAAGNFSFTLLPGTYTISVEIENGYVLSAPRTFTYLVKVISSPISKLTFGVKPIAVA